MASPDDIDTPLVDNDIPCSKCGYNLKTIHEYGRCPECGTKVSLTLFKRRQNIAKGFVLLKDADPAWLREKWWGFRMILILNLLSPVMAFAYFAHVPLSIKSARQYSLDAVMMAFASLSVVSQWLLLNCRPRKLQWGSREDDGSVGHRLLTGGTASMLAIVWLCLISSQGSRDRDCYSNFCGVGNAAWFLLQNIVCFHAAFRIIAATQERSLGVASSCCAVTILCLVVAVSLQLRGQLPLDVLATSFAVVPPLAFESCIKRIDPVVTVIAAVWCASNVSFAWQMQSMIGEAIRARSTD